MRHCSLAALIALIGACAALPAEGPAVAPSPLAPPEGEVQKRAFEIWDYYRTAFVEAPAASRDGRRVAFALRHHDVDAQESWSNVWMMAADGSDLRQMSAVRANDTSPSFSPDGRRLAFVSTRSGSSQVHVMPVDGGEPRQLTSFPTGVSDPVWSPDGRHIAVTAEIYPELGTDVDAFERAVERAEQGKLDVHLADDLLYRHWTAWSDGKKNHVLLIDAASGAVVKDLTPGPWESPAFSLGGRGYAFSPDGKELCFVSNRDARQAQSTNADLWIVPVDGDVSESSAVAITAENRGWDGAPLYSPDGRYLAYLSQETPAYESDLKRLALYDRLTRQTAYLTGRDSFDDMIDDLRWSPDGRSIYFQADVRGRTPLFRIGLASGPPELVHTHAHLGGWELVDAGARIVYAMRSVAQPPELWSVSASGGESTRLTHFNSALEAEVDLRPAQEMRVAGEDGYAIQVFVVTPHGFDPSRKYPLILNVHGGPQSQWADSYRGDWQVYPGKGYVVAFANPTGSTGCGQDYVDAISRDWGGRVYRDLMRVTDALAELPYVDAQRIGAMGWSYGGYMMMWMQGHTDRFRCQAAMMGVYDLPSFHGATEELWFPEHDLGGAPGESDDYERWSPSRHAASFRTPALVVTGERDYRVPYTQSLHYYTDLRRRDVPARLVVYPEAGHWPGWREMLFYYNVHLDWFHRWLGGDPAPWDVNEHARARRARIEDAGRAPAAG